jgi:hypothetical protein
MLPSVLSVANEVPAFVYFLMWYKILNYLTAFKPTRYLIKMIFEIVNDIKAFVIILFAAMTAYAQITYSLADSGDFYTYL